VVKSRALGIWIFTVTLCWHSSIPWKALSMRLLPGLCAVLLRCKRVMGDLNEIRLFTLGRQDTVGKSQEMCYHFNSTPERRNQTMPQLLVRDLDPDTVERLKLRARRHGRSLQGEVKAILEAAATFSMSEAAAVAEGWQRKLAGGMYTDSAEAIRVDREG